MVVGGIPGFFDGPQLKFPPGSAAGFLNSWDNIISWVAWVC
jgi:hypothetical protein